MNILYLQDHLDFTLEANETLSGLGLKSEQNLESDYILKTAHIKHNCNDRLIIDITDMVPLSSVYKGLNDAMVTNVIEAIADVFNLVSNKAFLEREFILMDMEHLYIDRKESRPKFMILPYSVADGSSAKEWYSQVITTVSALLYGRDTLSRGRFAKISNAIGDISKLPADDVLELMNAKKKVVDAKQEEKLQDRFSRGFIFDQVPDACRKKSEEEKTDQKQSEIRRGPGQCDDCRGMPVSCPQERRIDRHRAPRESEQQKHDDGHRPHLPQRVQRQVAMVGGGRVAELQRGPGVEEFVQADGKDHDERDHEELFRFRECAGYEKIHVLLCLCVWERDDFDRFAEAVRTLRALVAERQPAEHRFPRLCGEIPQEPPDLRLRSAFREIPEHDRGGLFNDPRLDQVRQVAIQHARLLVDVLQRQHDAV